MNRRTLLVALLAFALAALGGLALRWMRLAGQGEPCDTDGDCRGASAVCLQSHVDRSCTIRCQRDDQCEGDWVCREADLESGGEGSEKVCAPPKPTINSLRELGELGE